MPRYETVKGLFGQLIHFQDGQKVGESWDGLISGTRNHYDASGSFVGSSAQGILSDEVHYNARGERIGDSHTGLFGATNHYSADSGYVGSSYQGVFSNVTDLRDDVDPFGNKSDSFDPFDSDTDW